MNIVFFTGNVGSVNDVKTVKGSDVLNFSVAVRQGISRDGNTEWYRVAVWGQRANFLKDHITKGAKVAVVGDLEIGSYDGKPQFNVRAHDVDPFCGGKRDDTGSNSSSGRDEQRDRQADLDDDVPF